MSASLLADRGSATASSAGLTVGVYLLLATPWARELLEKNMAAHMLLQLPLLAGLGFIACRQLAEESQHRLLMQAGGSLPCLLVAFFASTHWMLPRALDAALSEPTAELAKFLTLPLFVGAPLSLAWRRLKDFGKGVVWTNFFSMLAVLGWLYSAAPVRVCNNYLVYEQQAAGEWMALLAIALFGFWLARLFIGSGGGAPARR